ncbi:RING-type E3 ubiquitin transferase [Heracleum sosnowskyi]|uniref:RING-type E3 ubiquitin transferase n=1 Tax=Heracleum sosnowskyi TaxID=360622 RepID=A0AAD8HA53_9APIA|nr:RING-type E3 ubiquitin transferase [Heracleum sosnowskyi]
MEISKLKALLKNISGLFHLSSRENLSFEPVQKYYHKVEEMMKVIRLVLDAIVDAEIASDELLQESFASLDDSVDELREIFETWHPLMSKVYFVLQVESLMTKMRLSGLDVFEFLKGSDQSLPVELSTASLEHCLQKLVHLCLEQTSAVITKATRDQVEGSGPSSDCLVKITESLSLKSNQELLIEAVALEKLKENAEQAEKNGEVDYLDQLLALVTYMHERLVLLKQSESYNTVQIPADFCCPLSLELMTDPVIVASGQTYERAFIRKWIDLGLTVCPKTRQVLAHTNLIPNYTVKALVAHWCESKGVKLPDPMRSMNLNIPSSLLKHAASGAPRDSQMTADSTHSSGSPGKNLVSSSVTNGERTSLSHPRSSSEDSLSEEAENGHGLNMDSMSPRRFENRQANSGDKSLDLGSQITRSPSGELPNVSRTNGPQVHNRTSSASSTLSTANFSQGIPSDSNEASSQVTAYGNDSGELTSERQSAATLSSAQREPEFSPRFEARSRTQSIWRRPSDRFVPRIVSSPAVETRAVPSAVETQIQTMVRDLNSTSMEVQRDATAELRLLAKHNMDNRIVIANCGGIPLLVNLLRSTDPITQENAVTALLNLSINDNNKAAIGNADAIDPLIYVLESGTPEAKENSAATLFSLSVIEDNKVKIGRSGAIQPLVDLLGHGTPRGKKDAATALFNLSIFHENKARIVQAGAVKYLVELMDPAAGMVDKAVAVLSNLATIHEGRAAIGQEGGIPVLVEVVELGSARGKENAAAALLQLCTNSSRFCNTVLQEGAVPPLVALSQSGTPRAKEKAQALLSYFRNQRHGNGGRG